MSFNEVIVTYVLAAGIVLSVIFVAVSGYSIGYRQGRAQGVGNGLKAGAHLKQQLEEVARNPGASQLDPSVIATALVVRHLEAVETRLEAIETRLTEPKQFKQ